MGRKTWVKPMTLVQKFEANEAVAAQSCLLVACISKAESTDGGFGITPNGAPESPWTHGEGYFFATGRPAVIKYNNINHKGACADKKNNIFRIDGDQVEFLDELSGGVDMGGFVKVTDDNGDGVISAGDTFYWWTRKYEVIVGASNYRQFNHWGKAESADPSKPNQS